MTSRNDRDLDELLGDGAGKLGALYRKLPSPQPPRRLDRHILGEASRAVHGRPHGPRWLVGFGAAAGVLLAAGIAWQAHDDVSIRKPVGAAAPATISESATQRPVTPYVVPVEAREAATAATRKPPFERKGFDGDATPAVSASGSRIATPADTRERAPLRPSAKLPATSAVPLSVEPTAQATPLPPAPPPAPPAPAAKPVVEAIDEMAASNATDSAVIAPIVAEQPAGSAQRSEAKAERRMAGAEAAPQPDATAAADATTAREHSPVDPTTDGAIAHIRALIKAGRRDQARDALTTLRQRLPDLVFPADLREFEREARR